MGIHLDFAGSGRRVLDGCSPLHGAGGGWVRRPFGHYVADCGSPAALGASPFSACHQRLSFRALGTSRHHSAPRKPVSARVVSTHPAFSTVFAFVFFSLGRYNRTLSFQGPEAAHGPDVFCMVALVRLLTGQIALVRLLTGHDSRAIKRSYYGDSPRLCREKHESLTCEWFSLPSVPSDFPQEGGLCWTPAWTACWSDRESDCVSSRCDVESVQQAAGPSLHRATRRRLDAVSTGQRRTEPLPAGCGPTGRPAALRLRVRRAPC